MSLRALDVIGDTESSKDIDGNSRSFSHGSLHQQQTFILIGIYREQTVAVKRIDNATVTVTRKDLIELQAVISKQHQLIKITKKK